MTERAAPGPAARPTDVELECAGPDLERALQAQDLQRRHRLRRTSERPATEIDSLFKTYIRRATDGCVGKRAPTVCLSVFNDNAGVIDFNDDWSLVFKVETHNSPSALDPYGGALTGIVGVNRDILGTGMAPADLQHRCLLLRPAVLRPAACPARLLHPGASSKGVHRGVERRRQQERHPDGQRLRSSSTTASSASRWSSAAPAGSCPAVVNGQPERRESRRCPATCIVMIGGRIGKDGIHGATFSSEELHEKLAGHGGADRRPDHPEEDVRLPDRGPRRRALPLHHRQRGRRPLLLGRRDGAGVRRRRDGPGPRARSSTRGCTPGRS